MAKYRCSDCGYVYDGKREGTAWSDLPDDWICHTNNCPAGIATQREELRARLHVDRSAHQLARFLASCVELMKVLARACGHRELRGFCRSDLTSWKHDLADLAGVPFAGAEGSEEGR